MKQDVMETGKCGVEVKRSRAALLTADMFDSDSGLSV
jgi:hypothetical protein